MLAISDSMHIFARIKIKQQQIASMILSLSIIRLQGLILLPNVCGSEQCVR